MDGQELLRTDRLDITGAWRGYYGVLILLPILLLLLCMRTVDDDGASREARKTRKKDASLIWFDWFEMHSQLTIPCHAIPCFALLRFASSSPDSLSSLSSIYLSLFFSLVILLLSPLSLSLCVCVSLSPLSLYLSLFLSPPHDSSC